MKVFFDAYNKLTWKVSDLSKEHNTFDEYKQIKGFNRKINDWKSDGISTYITTSEQPLGDYLLGLAIRNNKKGNLGHYYQAFAFAYTSSMDRSRFRIERLQRTLPCAQYQRCSYRPNFLIPSRFLSTKYERLYFRDSTTVLCQAKA